MTNVTTNQLVIEEIYEKLAKLTFKLKTTQNNTTHTNTKIEI